MLFNSIDFLIFLVIVFGLFWVLPREKLKLQNLLLLTSSYIFYGLWDWKFLLLIVFSSMVDFLIGKAMTKNQVGAQRKIFLYISLIVNLGLLGLFKYYDFFVEEFIDMLSIFDVNTEISSLNLILPVGISFYTFQSLSYSIDVYRREIEHCDDPVQFFTYVAFFPQLVAGPIERAKTLLPQFNKIREFDYEFAVKGVHQIIWGLFKKVVIADNCAVLVNQIFVGEGGYETSNSWLLIFGAILFAFQIYGDFSGYSDIAIGTAKLFGIQLMKNFDFPYFSRDIAEFWRKWHISLSTWFKDYIYFPLGGSRGGKIMTLRNVFVIFLVSGFWHGANWTYLMWGFIHAALFIPLYVLNINRKNLGVIAEHNMLPSLGDFCKILLTFVLVTIAWVFFRAESIGEAFDYLISIALNFDVEYTLKSIEVTDVAVIINKVIWFIPMLLIVEWCNRTKEYGSEFNNRTLQKVVSISAIVVVFFYGKFDYQEFIYFQF